MPYNLRKRKAPQPDVETKSAAELPEKTARGSEANAESRGSAIRVITEYIGIIQEVIGYSGPPGSKNIKVLRRVSRVITRNETEVLRKYANGIVTHAYHGVKGPKGRVEVPSELKAAMEDGSLFDEGNSSSDDDDVGLVIYTGSCHPCKITSIVAESPSGSSAAFCVHVDVAKGRSHAMVSGHRRFSAVLVQGLPPGATVTFCCDGGEHAAG